VGGAPGLLVIGQTAGVEEKLQAAETALQGVEADDQTRDLVGQIAAARATLAMNQLQVDIMLAQVRRALEHLQPKNLVFRTTARCMLGFSYLLQGDHATARQAYTEAIALSQASGNTFFT
jgi:LuxR family transcriptional regulator, maltose regulon positive regulatory protein